MAITKTVAIDYIEVRPAKQPQAEFSTLNSGNPTIHVHETISVDDTEDSDLPMIQMRMKTIYKFVEDGGSATDVSSEDALVTSIAGAIWS